MAVVQDVIVAWPAQKAGIAPGDKMIAVNNRQFTPTVLREAVQSDGDQCEPIELLVKSGEYYSTIASEYQGGEKYPHLVRDESKPDMLAEIMRAAA